MLVAMSSTYGRSLPAGAATLRGFVPIIAFRPKVGTTIGVEFVMLIPIIWIPGIALYGSPIIAWIFQWEEIPAIACMVTGWLMASSLVAAGAVGIISIIF